MRTPDNTLIFVTPRQAGEIVQDQIDCMGCLSACRFSNWSQHEPDYTTGKKADPRSFCIQKTLQDIAHGDRRAGAQPDVRRAQRLSASARTRSIRTASSRRRSSWSSGS